MEKIFFLIACALIVCGDLTTATSIECLYSKYTFESKYKCEVFYNPEIKVKESAKITSINEMPAKLNATFDNVMSFRVLRKTLIHFPRGLGSYFKNIEVIEIKLCHLKELEQLDLKQFPNLKRFIVQLNDIEVIEDGLFEFNLKLECLEILEKNIIHIAPNVFDNLSQLKVLRFQHISCINQPYLNKKKVDEKIQDVKKSCNNREFLSLIDQLDNLQNDPEISEVKLTNFEIKLQNSSLFDSGTLWERFEKLKPQKIYNPTIFPDPENLNCPSVTPSTMSIRITCVNHTRSFKFYSESTFERDYTYYCYLERDQNILTLESAEITSLNSKEVTYEKIEGFIANSGTIHYFPKGLDKFFKNLELIKIVNCHLKEIHQTDLKSFPKLNYFSLIGNAIKVIEEGLFDYNRKLEAIELSESNIIQIYPTVFDNLKSLECLKFENVPCSKITKINFFYEMYGMYESRRNVLKNIRILKKFCTNSEFMALDAEIKNIDIESKLLELNIENFEKNLNSSKFSNFRQFRNKIKCLIPSKINNSGVPQIENLSNASSGSSQNSLFGNFFNKIFLFLNFYK